MEKETEYLKKYYHGNLKKAIKRLEKGEAVQYIVGSTNFYGYDLMVNKNVLIPRRETEELTEEVIKRSSVFNHPVIIDVGTGSGAIAIALSKELKTHIYASDISKRAIRVAYKNNLKNDSDVTFYHGDMLKPFIKNNLKVDIIVSNPPYIKFDEEIEKVVFDNEPYKALFAGHDGLEFYEKILKSAKNILKDKFLIAFEIGQTQGKSVEALAHKYLGNVEVEIKQDLSKKDRMVFVYNY